jgi:hypothetical protein
MEFFRSPSKKKGPVAFAKDFGCQPFWAGTYARSGDPATARSVSHRRLFGVLHIDHYLRRCVVRDRESA